MIDGRALYDGNRFRGIGVYLRHLVDNLDSPPELSVSALVKRGTPLPAHIKREVVHRRLSNRFAALEHNLKLPFDIGKRDFDVYHSPSQEPPRRSARPWVQTMHAVDDHPSLVREQERWRRLGPRLRQAAAVIVPSEHARGGVIDLLALDPARVHVVPHGVDACFRPGRPPRRREPPYVLSVGEYGPWKGYAEAFEVISKLARAGLPHRLKVVGQVAPWVAPEVNRLMSAFERPDRIDLLDFVPMDQLPRVYQGASALLMTSRCESFGLPLVEAMASGVPVVAFDNTAIPEIVGDGGVLVPDGDVTAMTEELVSLLGDATRSQILSERGQARAKAFDWGRSAAAHTRIYLEVARR